MIVAQVVFAWAKDAGSQQQLDEAVSGAEVRLFQTELEMLNAWLGFFMEADPDALILFQVRPARPCSPQQACPGRVCH